MKAKRKYSRKRMPQCRPFFETHDIAPTMDPFAAAGQAEVPSIWSVPALCKAYSWPANLAGGGVIAIIEMGGGYVQGDIDTYFGNIGQPSPQIVNVLVNGAGNNPNQQPGLPVDFDCEVALDIEVAGASYYVATGKAASIRVYWTDTNVMSLAPAIKKAAEEGCAVCSISWGTNEDNWALMSKMKAIDLIAQLDAAILAAAELGMTVFASSGDSDAYDGGGRALVNLPAACPHAVGCGGTTKTLAGETVWNNNPGDPSGNGTGGGYSRRFPVQPWTKGAPVGAGRMVPDVAANADKQSGYVTYVHGAVRITGGTSAVAPLYAGLFAAFGKGRGFVNPTIWQNPDCFDDIVHGNNGVYQAEAGPDPCTGMGAPNGQRLANLFLGAALP